MTEKNTLVTIVKKDIDGNITGLQKILAESFITAEIPEGWEKVDNRPVLMKLVGDKYEEEVNPDYDEVTIQKIEDHKQAQSKV